MRRSIAANRIEGHRGRSARQPAGATERRNNPGIGGKLSGGDRFRDLRRDYLALVEKRLRSAAYCQKPSGVSGIRNEEQPTVFEGLDPARCGIASFAQINVDSGGDSRSKA